MAVSAKFIRRTIKTTLGLFGQDFALDPVMLSSPGQWQWHLAPNACGVALRIVYIRLTSRYSSRGSGSGSSRPRHQIPAACLLEHMSWLVDNTKHYTRMDRVRLAFEAHSPQLEPTVHSVHCSTNGTPRDSRGEQLIRGGSAGRSPQGAALRSQNTVYILTPWLRITHSESVAGRQRARASRIGSRAPSLSVVMESPRRRSPGSSGP